MLKNFASEQQLDTVVQQKLALLLLYHITPYSNTKTTTKIDDDILMIFYLGHVL